MARRMLLMVMVCTLLTLRSSCVVADDLTYEQLLSRLQDTEQRLLNLEQQQPPIFRTAVTANSRPHPSLCLR